MNEIGTKPVSDEVETDLAEVLFVLWHRVLWLLAGLAAGAVLAFGVTKLLITPQYTASSMIYIFTKTTSITSLADLQVGSQLTVDFQTLGTSRPVVEKVISELNLDTTYEKLLDTITITNPSNSRILKISVENPDPQLAADISNAMASSLSNRVAEVLNTDKPSTVETAVVPEEPSSPSTGRNAAIGALLGLMAVAAAVLLQHFMDDSVKDNEDVEKYLALNTLASIPMEYTAGKGSAFRSGSKNGPNSHKTASVGAEPSKSRTVSVTKAVTTKPAAAKTAASAQDAEVNFDV